jgi:hypothetical protein
MGKKVFKDDAHDQVEEQEIAGQKTEPIPVFVRLWPPQKGRQIGKDALRDNHRALHSSGPA